MNRLDPYDLILCRIQLRPIYKGRKVNKKVADAYNGKVMRMRAMWQMDEEDKYPDEWALVPADNDEWSEMCKLTGWIASGDVEMLNSDCHEEEITFMGRKIAPAKEWPDVSSDQLEAKKACRPTLIFREGKGFVYVAEGESIAVFGELKRMPSFLRYNHELMDEEIDCLFDLYTKGSHILQGRKEGE